MKISLRTYAHAYLEACDDARTAVAAFETCADAVTRVPMLRAFLSNTSVPSTKRREALALAAPKQPEATYNFFLLLAHDRRLHDLASLNPVLRAEAATKENKRHAVVTSAIPLPAPTLRRLTNALTQHFQQDIWLESHVDPSIVAGLHIHSGDWTFDATRRGRLTRLEQTLTV